MLAVDMRTLLAYEIKNKKRMRVFRLSYLLLCFVLIISCETVEDKPLRYLGDIPFSKLTDNKEFVICNGEQNVFQYFNLGDNLSFEGGKRKLISVFDKEYNSQKVTKESGMVRIRFIVNCNGETNRFRILESDLRYQEKSFDNSIINQLLSITRALNGWGPKYNNGKAVDYYQYLIFRIVDGQIIKILP